MFDLEKSIAEWRRQMLAAGIKTPVPLDELESHLREEIERQMKAGHSGEEAFTSAIQKIGPAHIVQKEFMKIGTFLKRPNWKWFTVLFLAYTALYPLLVGSLMFIFKNGVFSEMNGSQQILGLLSAVVFSLAAWGTQWSCGKYPLLRTNRIRDAIFVPVMLWLVVLAYVIMPHSGLTESQGAVVSLWGFAPFGIAFGWVWGFAHAAKNEAPIQPTD
jgi:hypothetical protein